MKFLTTILSLLLGTPTAKHDLRKKPTRQDLSKTLNCWIQRNFYIIALIFLIILMIMFVWVCFAIVGVSATESGTVYNQFDNII